MTDYTNVTSSPPSPPNKAKPSLSVHSTHMYVTILSFPAPNSRMHGPPALTMPSWVLNSALLPYPAIWLSPCTSNPARHYTMLCTCLASPRSISLRCGSSHCRTLKRQSRSAFLPSSLSLSHSPVLFLQLGILNCCFIF